LSKIKEFNIGTVIVSTSVKVFLECPEAAKLVRKCWKRGTLSDGQFKNELGF